MSEKPKDKSPLALLGEMILASGSPARLEVLRKLGAAVIACPTDADETHDETKPENVVRLLSRRKLDKYLSLHPENLDGSKAVITCDTLVWCPQQGACVNSENPPSAWLLGKPKDEADAFGQLRLLSGRTHQVYTGYCLFCHGKVFEGFDVANVAFNPLSDEEILQYLASGEYRGAAGSYRIQGKASGFIRKIDGDVDTVAGIPTRTLEKIILRNLLSK